MPEAPASPPDEIEGFRATIRRSFGPVEVLPRAPAGFVGRVRLRSLDHCRLTRIVADAHDVRSTGRPREADAPISFKAVVLLEGRGVLRQFGREARLESADVAIYDASSPYSMEFDEHIDLVTLTFPHDALELAAEAVRRVCAVTFSGSEGLGTVVSPFMSGLGRRVDDTTGPTAVALAHSALDLMSILLVDEVERAQRDADPRDRLRLRIHAFVEEHLSDPTLDPAAIARAHFISTRHLHGLFQQEGLTVSGWIRTRRGENLRRDLLDPRLAECPIGELGRRWGFVDAAQLSHTFTARYGEPPSAVRARVFDVS